MGKRKIKWQSGDNFLVPLKDGSFGQGQVLSYEAQAMNSVICAFSSKHFVDLQEQIDGISEADLIAVQFVTRDLLDNGRWKVVNNRPIIQWEKLIDIQAMRSKGFIGVSIQGSLIMANFLNAYHKLIPWNHYYDPDYFDKLLISPDHKPAGLLLK